MPSDTPVEASPPPGRCGVAGPGDGLFCELRAGHTGMHEARQYPVGVVSAGVPAYWPQVSPEPGGVTEANGWTVRDWENWSNEVAAALPEDYDGDEAQEDLILRFVQHAAAGITLTPDEAALAARALRGWSHEWASKWYAGDTDDEAGTSLDLAARLEAGS